MLLTPSWTDPALGASDALWLLGPGDCRLVSWRLGDGQQAPNAWTRGRGGSSSAQAQHRQIQGSGRLGAPRATLRFPSEPQGYSFSQASWF